MNRPKSWMNSHNKSSTSPTMSRITTDFDADEATLTSIAATVGGRRLSLYSPSDEAYLSPLVCLIRSQIEVFSATEADVQARAAIGHGRFASRISAGRVGVRCIHCRDRPAKEQAKGAVSYPTSIRVLNQAMRNWQRFHWGACTLIPTSARAEFERLTSGKKTSSSRKSQEYWIRRSGEMGLVDTSTKSLAGLPTRTGTVAGRDRNEECMVESEGIYFEADARKLGLRVLMPPEEKASGATKKTAKGRKEKARTDLNDTSKRSNGKRKGGSDTNQKDAGDESQIIGGNGPKIAIRGSNGEDVPSALHYANLEPADVFPTMNSYLGLDEFGDDASLMSDLERLVGETDEESNDDASGSMVGNMLQCSATPSHAPVEDSNDFGSSGQVDVSSVPERDVQLLSTLRVVREMVRTLRGKYDGTSRTSSQIAVDLHSLGETLYKALSGENREPSLPSERFDHNDRDVDSDERLPKRERRREEGRPEDSAVPLQDLGYPTSISIFVQSLIDATDEDAVERFTCMSDVDNDLQLMIEHPDKYLFGLPQVASTGRLGVSSDLYGIQMQRNKLMHAFESVVLTGEELRGLALISGRSGSGKTSLVETLCGPLSERRGRLIQIKFDKKDNQSMPSVFRALDQYCQDLQGDLDLLTEVAVAVKSALGNSGHILLSQMPNLSTLVGDVSTPLPSIANKEKYHLLLNSLRAFVRAISAPSHPTVILFDDLQWADNEALDFITKVVMDAETRSCLFVGCYRDNEVLTDHPLLEYLGGVAFAGVPMWQIFQKSIGKDATNELVSDTLHLSPRITAPLAREIQKKTGGNPHFVKQLLQSLSDEQLLQYSPNARRWQWDIAAIRSKTIPENAVALLLERMTHYGPDVQRVLQVAALMGRRFDALAMKMFQAGGDVGGDGSAILAHIDTVVDDGLVCIDKAELRFAHDSIWEAALSLTPITERERMHLLIGRHLLSERSRQPQEILDFHLQLIVDQMNRGANLIRNHDEKQGLAELNLEMGQRALSSSSFFEASLYLLQGSALLSHQDWDGNYKLCLEMFSACAEAQLAHGSSAGAIVSANAVILHGRSLNDTLRAHYIITTGLFTQGKIEEACQAALRVLEELGIRFPSLGAPIDQDTVRIEIDRTETLLKSLRLEDIMTRTLATDVDDALTFAMRFLWTLCPILYIQKPDMLVLVACRMMQICVNGTLMSEAAVAFAVYSSVLCKLRLRDRSAVCARMAMALLDRFHGKYSHEVLLLLNISIQPYCQPWHACLDSFERASRDATAVGDVVAALFCHSCVTVLYVFSTGSTLQDARSILLNKRETLRSCEHPHFFVPMVYLQILLNLIASDATSCDDVDPTILQGDATNQEDILVLLPQSSAYYGRLVRKADFARLFLGYLFRRYDVVLEMASKVKDHLTTSKTYPAVELLLERFHLGLAAYSIVRRGGGSDVDNGGVNAEDWLAIADDVTNQMKTLSENDSKWNFQQKYFLLEAEQAFTGGDVEAAAAAYRKAIETAKEHRFINEQALASECAALFYLEYGDIGRTCKYLEKSRDLYQAWGAHRKVDDIRSLLVTVQ